MLKITTPSGSVMQIESPHSVGAGYGKLNIKTVASIDIEKYNAVSEFAESVTQLPRLEQGIQYFKENNIDIIPENLGQYIKWVNQDIFKEEMDAIVENQLDTKAVAKAIAPIARKFYLGVL